MIPYTYKDMNNTANIKPEDFKLLADKVDKIYCLLVGDEEVKTEGLLNEHKQMWESYKVSKFLFGFFGLGSIASIFWIIDMLRQMLSK